MSEIKRNFLQGKMNLDLDERLIPNGQYVDALNIHISHSEGSDVGAIETAIGNRLWSTMQLTNAKCIGAIADDAKQTIYYFITSDEQDLICEFNAQMQRENVIVRNYRDAEGKTVLNFQKNNLITGVAKIISGNGEDLLAWTDDNEQPRIINIERAKKTLNEDIAPKFEEDDISLIKKPPIFAPETRFTYATEIADSTLNNKFLSFAYSYTYLDGEVSALSPFTPPAFAPTKFKLDQHTFENEGMQNAFSAIDLVFNTGSKRVTEVTVVFKESNSNVVYVVDTFNKKDKNWNDNEDQVFKFTNNKVYRVLEENELFRHFDSVPRKAKALAIIGNRIALGNYLEGYNLINKYGENINLDYDLSLYTKTLSGAALTLAYGTLNANNDLVTLDFGSAILKKNTRLTVELSLIEKTNGTGTFSGTYDFILNKDYEDCVKLSTDKDFTDFLKVVLTGGFLTGYSTTPPANGNMTGNTEFLVDSATAKTITIKAPSVIYTIDNTPADPNDSDFTVQSHYWGYLPATTAYFKETAIDSSCKTNRSYEVSALYLDEYGRSTTALTSTNNTLYIPQKHSVSQNKIRVNMYSKPPVWAKYLRFAIKQDRKEYQNVYVSTFYEDGLFRWIKLEGANKEKVKEGDTLIVKSDLSGAVSDIVKVRVLEIKSQPEDFITDNLDDNDVAIKEKAGLYMKIKAGAFDMNYQGDTFLNFNGYDRSTKRARIYLGAFGNVNSDGSYSDFPIKAGSVIDLYVKSYGRGDTKIFEKSFVATADYVDFEKFFLAEVKTFDNKVNDWYFYRAGGKLMLFLESYEHGVAANPTKIRADFNFRFTDGMLVFETEASDALSEIFYETSQTFEISEDQEFHKGNIQDQTVDLPAVFELDFFNCYCMGNGVESFRFKDALNKRYLNYDTRPTAKSVSPYREVRRFADITYSEAYVDSLGVNGLNNFNAAKANYKDDIVKKYGSIQKMIGRNDDLLVFQEDKVSRVLYGKELVLSPDNTSTLAATDQVLGTQVFYAGEHGISTNPESVGIDGNRIWFTDEKRGDVNRLSADGITKISQYGMSAWFRERFAKTTNRIKVGSFDPYTEQYTLSTNGVSTFEPLIKIKCDEKIEKHQFVGTLKAEIDYGIATGECGLTFSVQQTAPIKVKLTWDGNVYESLWTGAMWLDYNFNYATGYNIQTETPEPLMFNKTKLYPNVATLEVFAPWDLGASFEINGICTYQQEFSVVSIVNSNKADAGLTINNRYKWILGNYASPYKHFPTTFVKDGGVSIYNKETGREGIGVIPPLDSRILVESFKGFADTGSFGDDDSIGYFVSNTEYTAADVEVIKGLATKLPTTELITAGGEVTNSMTFNLLRPNLEKFLYLLWDYSSLSININTYIFIYFDSSGSMNSTLTPLQVMRDTILKDALLPLYENNEAEYNAKVQVISHSSERTLHMLNFLAAAEPTGNVITLVFQDEADPTYHTANDVTWGTSVARTTQFDLDLAALRTRLNSFPANYYRGIIFQVETGNTGNFLNFKRLVTAYQNGQGNYSGSNGLSDRSEFAFKYGITAGSTSQYYKDLIVNTFRELGYNL